MLPSLITSALTTILTAIIFTLMARGNNVPVTTNTEGKKTLRVQKFMLYLSFVCIALCVVCCLAPLLIGAEEGLAVLLAPILMALFFGFAGAFFLFDYKNSRIIYDHKSILIRDYRNRETEIAWRNLKRVSHNSLKNQIVLRDGMNQVGFNQYMKGVSTLLDDMEKYANVDMRDVQSFQENR